MNTLIQYRRCFYTLIMCSALAYAQDVTLSAHVALVSNEKHSKAHATDNVVLWLTPIDVPAAPISATSSFPEHPRLAQKNKSFEPHVLVVPVGAMVEFPNQDPFFHNVFSLFEGKRFDLGLYEAGSTRDVHFDKRGISYIFCNIHAEMSAVVIALDTPYYGISNKRGEVLIPHVPPGRYMLHTWYEQALPETLDAMARQISVSENSSTLGVLRLTAAALPAAHKNKYGRDYDPPTPDSPAYTRP